MSREAIIWSKTSAAIRVTSARAITFRAASRAASEMNAVLLTPCFSAAASDLLAKPAKAMTKVYEERRPATSWPPTQWSQGPANGMSSVTSRYFMVLPLAVLLGDSITSRLMIAA